MANAVDKEQIEMISKWWKDYGKGITIAIVVGLLIGFGWRYWSQHKQHHKNAASVQYQALFNAVTMKDKKSATMLMGTLKKDFKDTPYSSMGALMLAKEDITQQKTQAARAQFRWVIAHGQEKSLRQIARIRLARVLLSDKQYAAAQKVLLKVDDKIFQPLIDSVKGNIYLAEGHSAQAKEAYQAAKAGYQKLGIDNPFIDMQLTQ